MTRKATFYVKGNIGESTTQQNTKTALAAVHGKKGLIHGLMD